MRIIFSLFLVAWMGFSSCSTNESPVRPNIILIMTDDQGWFDAGFNGNEKIRTPHLDHLASQGIILDRFYSASAVCSPTRASVITGRNPLKVAKLSNPTERPTGVDLNSGKTPTWKEMIQE